MSLKTWRAVTIAAIAGSIMVVPRLNANSQEPGQGSKTQVSTSSAPAANNTVLWNCEAEPAHPGSEDGLAHFGKLDAHVWRSAQPTKRGFQRLAELGIKTIVNLRVEFPQEKDLVPAGVNYVQIPITDETAPTEEQANQFLKIVSNPANWPVLVHCRAGQGRTGVMCALVRYSIDGWKDGQIRKEVGNYRSSFMGMFRSPLCSPQQKFLANWYSHNQPGAWKGLIGAPQDAQAAQTQPATSSTASATDAGAIQVSSTNLPPAGSGIR
jgi:protein tyrosine phosphatase (PTP) superfamily phosphohydrolase (DUF442 family)